MTINDTRSANEIPAIRIRVNLSKKSPQRRKDAEVLESFRLKFLLIFTKISTVFFAPDGRGLCG